MKPKPIMVKQDTLKFDTLTTEQPPIYKKFKVETPVGTLESDSGNHIVDVITIISVIAVLYAGKKLFDKYIK